MEKDIKILIVENNLIISFRIKRVIDYINDNIYNTVDITELSKITKWKTHHFIRMFNKEVGITPYQYVLHKKIEKACELIKDSDLTLVEIAYELGFQNYISFWRSFKRFKNINPEDYKNLNYFSKTSSYNNTYL